MLAPSGQLPASSINSDGAQSGPPLRDADDEASPLPTTTAAHVAVQAAAQLQEALAGIAADSGVDDAPATAAFERFVGGRVAALVDVARAAADAARAAAAEANAVAFRVAELEAALAQATAAADEPAQAAGAPDAAPDCAAHLEEEHLLEEMFAAAEFPEHGEPEDDVDDTLNLKVMVNDTETLEQYLFRMLSWKQGGRVTNAAFDAMLFYIKNRLLTQPNNAPTSFYMVKKLTARCVAEHYEHHSCPKGCMRFPHIDRRKLANPHLHNIDINEKCTLCSAPRFRINRRGVGDYEKVNVVPTCRFWDFNLSSIVKSMHADKEYLKLKGCGFTEPVAAGTFYAATEGKRLSRMYPATHNTPFLSDNSVHLEFGGDGLQMFKRGIRGATIIDVRDASLPAHAKGKNAHIYPLIVSEGEPSSMDAFFSGTVDTLLRHGPGGTPLPVPGMPGQTLWATAFHADSVFRAKVAGCVGHGGYCGCQWCLMEGVYEGRAIRWKGYSSARIQTKMHKGFFESIQKLPGFDLHGEACPVCTNDPNLPVLHPDGRCDGRCILTAGDDMDGGGGTRLGGAYETAVQDWGRDTATMGDVHKLSSDQIVDRGEISFKLWKYFYHSPPLGVSPRSNLPADTCMLNCPKHLDLARELGAHEKCVFQRLEYIDLRNFFVLPAWHAMLYGVVKGLLKLMLSESGDAWYIINSVGMAEIKNREERMTSVGDYNDPHKAFNSKSLGWWSMDNILHFTLTHSCIVFGDAESSKKVMDPKLFDLWQDLRRVVKDWLWYDSQDPTRYTDSARVNAAHARLMAFAKKVEDLVDANQLPPSCLSFNLHILVCRLRDQELACGCVALMNELWVERSCGNLKRSTNGRSMNTPELVGVNELITDSTLHHMACVDPELTTIDELKADATRSREVHADTYAVDHDTDTYMCGAAARVKFVDQFEMSVINAMIATCLRDDEGSHLTLTKDPPQIFAKACKGGDEEIKSHLYNMSHTRVNDWVKLRFQGDGTYIGKVMYFILFYVEGHGPHADPLEAPPKPPPRIPYRIAVTHLWKYLNAEGARCPGTKTSFDGDMVRVRESNKYDPTAHNVEGGGTYNGLEREHAHRYLYPVPIDNIDCKMNASDEKLRDGRKDLLFSTPFIASRARRIVAARRTMPVVCIAE